MTAAADAYRESIDVGAWELPSVSDFLAKVQNDVDAAFSGRGEAGDQAAQIGEGTDALAGMEVAAERLAGALGIAIGEIDGSAESGAELTAVLGKAKPLMEAAGLTMADLKSGITLADMGDSTMLDSLLARIAGEATVAASGVEQYTTAAERQAGSSERSVAAAKAQAEAFAEVRQAAADTASGFFDLSSSADTATASFDGWIASMEEQAAALRDFTQNTVKAAENGINKGLIESVRALGPEGAKQMKWLADASQSEMERVNRAFKSGAEAPSTDFGNMHHRRP